MADSFQWAIIRTDERVDFRRGKPSLKDLQDAVGGWIEAVPHRHPDFSAFCNEEGKINGLPLNSVATNFTGIHGDVLVGDVVITGPPDEEGENTSLPDNVIERLSACATGTALLECALCGPGRSCR